MSPLLGGTAERHTTTPARHQNSESGEAPGKWQRGNATSRTLQGGRTPLGSRRGVYISTAPAVNAWQCRQHV